jgi:hypothetical protein
LVKEADYRHRRLLRLRDKRPCDRGAAEQCDEVTPFQLFEWHPMPHEPTGASKSAFDASAEVCLHSSLSFTHDVITATPFP